MLQSTTTTTDVTIMIFSRIFLLLGLCAAATIAAPAASSSSPQCIDESGKAVDWYIVYKFPYLSHLHQKLFGGYRYAVLTSAANDGWHLSANNITDHQNSIFAKTLAPVYGSSSKLSTVFYNDQPPGPESVPSSYAHSKGVVVGDEKQGFWLIHTVPHFAPSEGSVSGFYFGSQQS